MKFLVKFLVIIDQLVNVWKTCPEIDRPQRAQE